MKDQTYFSKDWLENPDFKNWSASCTNNTQARWKLCQKTFNLSNIGRQALVSHASGKTHKLHDSRVQMFFKPATVKQTSTSADSSQSSSTQSSSTQSSNNKETIAEQSTLDLVVRNSETAKAEIIWVLKCVASRYSNNSCHDLQKIFSAMFTNSNIAKSITVGADKMRYVVNFGIAPVF